MNRTLVCSLSPRCALNSPAPLRPLPTSNDIRNKIFRLMRIKYSNVRRMKYKLFRCSLSISLDIHTEGRSRSTARVSQIVSIMWQADPTVVARKSPTCVKVVSKQNKKTKSFFSKTNKNKICFYFSKPERNGLLSIVRSIRKLKQKNERKKLVSKILCDCCR